MRVADWIDRHRRLMVLVLFTLITAVMLTNYLPAGIADEDGYLAYSHALVNGRYWTTEYGGQFLWWGPGMPLLLAPFVVTHSPLLVTRLVFGPVMLVATVCVIWRVLMIETGPRIAALGSAALGLLVAFLGVTLVHLGAIYSEPANGLAIAVALLLWVKCRANRDWRFAVGAGIALSAAAMIRVEWGLIISAGLVLAVLVWLIRRTVLSRLGLVAMLVAMAGCLPWLAYTRSESGRNFVWGTSGGLSFYWTASAKPPLQGDWISPGQVASDPRLRQFRSEIRQRFTKGGPYLWDAYLKSEGIKRIANDPGQFAINASKNFERLVSRFPLSFETTPAAAYRRAIPVSLLFVAALLTAVMLSLRRRWREVAFAPVFGLLAFIALHLVTSAYPRYVIPMLPLLIWFVGRGTAVLRSNPQTEYTQDAADL